MDQAEQSTKNPKLAYGARVRILEKYLAMGDAPENKKFKDPAAPKKPKDSEDLEMVIGGD